MNEQQGVGRATSCQGSSRGESIPGPCRLQRTPTAFGLWPLPPSSKPGSLLHASTSLLCSFLPPSYTSKDLWDYIAPTQVIQKAPLTRGELISNLNFISNPDSPIPCNLPCSYVLDIRTWEDVILLMRVCVCLSLLWVHQGPRENYYPENFLF